MLKANYLDSVPDALVELYSEAELTILGDMARRISQYDYYIPAAQWQQKRLLESGTTYSEIIKGLTAISGKSEATITALMKEAGMKTVETDNVIYKAAGKTPKPFLATPAVKAVYKAGLANTNKLFKNLTKTAAAQGSKLFGDTMDLVYLQVTSGAFDINTATRNAIKKLASNGLPAVKYPSGRTDNIEVAVRRSVLTGVNQTTAKMQLALAADMECGFVETSAHGGARPEHAAWQGQVFSLDGPKDGYEDFYLATGYGTGAGLCGWNCRHDFAPFFPGISSPAYSKEVLQDYEAKNYSYNGRKMTEYEAQQKQRHIERVTRKWKREYVMAEATKIDTTESALGLAKWRSIEKDFLAQTGLKQQADRTLVAGFGRGVAQKAVQKAKYIEKYSKIRYNADGTIVVTNRWTSHRSIPNAFHPNAVLETVAGRGDNKQINRTIYDSDGREMKQIHSGPHGNAKQHPYGNHGEHAHDVGDHKRSTRELTDVERREHSDIL